MNMVANFMAVGPMCLHTSKFPKLPEGRQVIHLMGILNIFKRGTRKENINMNWILFDGGDEEMKAWLEAIKVTLPPPPPRPERPYPTNNNAQPSAPVPSYNVTNYGAKSSHFTYQLQCKVIKASVYKKYQLQCEVTKASVYKKYQLQCEVTKASVYKKYQLQCEVTKASVYEVYRLQCEVP
ncbi:unnamed protein product [Mytilus coruscus]|uniref:PH domain-containing protein n=1 Tax=Mytilus coruscus TaxID=42192 RepID=A0A6J8E1R1_MYTCO|nr:unnamed protein product [Mytilus coruscus]